MKYFYITIILILFLLFLIINTVTTENFSVYTTPLIFNNIKSSMQNFNIKENSNKTIYLPQAYNSSILTYNTIRPSIIYNYRYISLYYLVILNTICVTLTKYYNNNVYNHQTPNNKLHYKTVVLEKFPPLSQIVKNLFVFINNNFNTHTPVIYYDNTVKLNYTRIINRFTIIITFYKSPLYDVKYFYNDYKEIDTYKNLDKRKLLLVLDRIILKKNPVFNLNYVGIIDVDSSIYSFNPTNAPNNYWHLKNSQNINFFDSNNIIPTLNSHFDGEAIIRSGQCFNINNLNIFNKADNNTRYPLNCEVVGGVYDYPCTTDSDCPFYRKNLNYSNNFGGCEKLTGYCELPLGLSNFTFKRNFPNEKPLCHNCHVKGLNNLNTCCEEQNDKTKYPDLVSPDFAFYNDYEDRNKTIRKNPMFQINKSDLPFFKKFDIKNFL